MEGFLLIFSIVRTIYNLVIETCDLVIVLLGVKAQRTGDQAPADWRLRLSMLGVKAQ